MAEVATVFNPSDLDEPVGEVTFASAEAALEAVDRARQAQREWGGRSALARGEVLYRAAELLAARAEALAQLASREMGKPIGEMRGEVARGVALLRYYGGEGARALGEVYPSAQADALLYTWRMPLGVVVAITPWNFPVAIPIWKLAPALVFGNAVIFKPAEWSSLTALELGRLFQDAGLPEGVLQVLPGRGTEVGAALVQAPVDAISFTGSEATGRRIAAAALEHGAKVQLEMGGKNAVVVWADANLERAVELTVSGAMRSAGQKCTATSRVLVHRAVAEEFGRRLKERLASLRLGPALAEDSYLGPVVSQAQQAKIVAHIERARREGARVAVGGEAPERVDGRRGHWVRPTLLEEVHPEMAIAQEEVFGPVLALLPVDGFDEAVAVLNRVRYGLSATLMTASLDLALRFAREAEVGMVRVNEETAGVEYQAPFGGEKASSSHSREQGRAALEFYTTTRTVTLRPSGLSG